ncbi:electron transfer flavoprotein subunit alpha [Candidatus Bathyarchaeota archaeon]|nr:electron transfer flavoprotein subunit alpha [Candidatus Bathyarchaeota archaeon]
MSRIIIHQEHVDNFQDILQVCPFNALERKGDEIRVNAACKLCKVCTKKFPDVFELVLVEGPTVDKKAWRGVVVWVEHDGKVVHPVTYELLGKARDLAAVIDHPVYCLLVGCNVGNMPDSLFKKGADEVFVYDDHAFKDFRIEPYAAAFEHFINEIHPSTILVGGTTIGRSLAPRVAARFRTGLTADCTKLEMQPSTDLDQIRPAFGGNIMAHIRTPNHRPQFATVRYKIFNEREACDPPNHPKIHCHSIDKNKLKSAIKVLETREKPKVKSLEEADTIIVAGRGVKKKEDLEMVEDLAKLLDAELATTRPLIEAGWADPLAQIGLSGRTVKPELIITCGVSGSVQFRAGMNGSGCIIAINTDENAPIFDIAHLGVVGDLYEIIPCLIDMIKNHVNEKC